MKRKYVLGLALTLSSVLLLSLGAAFGISRSASAQLPDYEHELRRVTEEIRLLNLINGLELSREQMEFIIQKAEEAEQLRAGLLEEMNNGNQKISQALQTLQELKDILLNGENIPDELKVQTHRSSLLTKEMTLEYQSQVSQLAVEIKAILQPHQLCALENYVPCLIPPKPWAYGQEDDSEAGARQLTRIREIPDPVFEENKDKIAQRIIEQMKLQLPRGYTLDEEAERRWLISLLEEARGLSDVDFAIEGTELAEKLKSRYAPARPAVDITVKIESFLLNPEIISLLESKLAADTGSEQ
jgi:hypothetical protein